MTTITIPKDVGEGARHLIAIPRDIYKEFLSLQKKLKSLRTFGATPSEKQALKRARKNFSRGKFIKL